MKKFLFIVIAILSTQNLSAQSYMALVDSADYHISNENWGKAETFILDALKKEPANYNNSLLLSNLATIQRNQNRHNEALNNYTLALNITPNAVTLLKNRASLLLELENLQAAYSDYKKIVEREPKDIESHYYLGIIALGLNEMVFGKSCFDEISKIDSKALEAKEGYALWYKLNGDFDNSLAYYNALVAANPSSVHLSGRAECLLAKKQLLQASVDINDALKLDSENGYLYLLKARLNKLQYQNDEAIKNANLAIKYGIDKELANDVVK